MLTNLITLSSKSRQQGLTAVEYAVAGGLLVVALAAIFATFGPALATKITAMLS